MKTLIYGFAPIIKLLEDTCGFILRYLHSKLDQIWPNARQFSKWEDDRKRREEITEIYGLFDDDYAFNFMKKSGKMNCRLKHHLQISVPPKAEKCDLL